MATTVKNQTKGALDTHNVVTADELYNILNMQLDEMERDPEAVLGLPPILIHGSPGCGKSSVVRQVCEDRGIEFLDRRLCEMEPADIRGLPVPNREEKCMDWYVNGGWPRNQKGKGIIFLDELTSADRSIQAAAYEFVLDRRLGGLYEVPKGYLIVAAGNNSTDKAIACTMSSALANRFLHVELREDVESWLAWGRDNDVEPAVLGFVQFRPGLLFSMEGQNLERGWPSPRSWERVSRVCRMFGSSGGKDDSVLRKLVYGLVGNGAGVEFMEFYRMNAKFSNILDMMTDPNAKVEVPKKADELYAMCSAMTYLLWRGRTAEDTRKRIDGFFRISMKLPSDFATMALLASISSKDPDEKRRRSKEMLSSPAFRAWQKEHGKALAKGLSL